MAARLFIHSARWQPERTRTNVCEPLLDDVARRPVAWSALEFRFLGGVAWAGIDAGPFIATRPNAVVLRKMVRDDAFCPLRLAFVQSRVVEPSRCVAPFVF